MNDEAPDKLSERSAPLDNGWNMTPSSPRERQVMTTWAPIRLDLSRQNIRDFSGIVAQQEL